MTTPTTPRLVGLSAYVTAWTHPDQLGTQARDELARIDAARHEDGAR